MTIRELISCMDSTVYQKFHIRTNTRWIKLVADLDDQNDLDFIVLDALAEMRIISWYVNPDAAIVIYPEEDLTEEQVQLCKSNLGSIMADLTLI